jgi:CDP-diglyceride synthetase
MKNHIYNFLGGAIPCFTLLQIPPDPTNANPISQALKAIVSIIIGVLGSLITNWLNKKLQAKKEANSQINK